VVESGVGGLKKVALTLTLTLKKVALTSRLYFERMKIKVKFMTEMSGMNGFERGDTR
jgi:hypothetical protein